MEINLGEVSLEAEIHVSAHENSPFFLLSHPHPVYGGTMDHKVIDQFFRRSRDKKYSALRYNMRGVGKSTGAYDHGVGEERDLENLIHWVDQQKIAMSQMVLFGYSFGSWITAKVAAKQQKTCILIAPPISLYEFPALTFSKPKLIFSAQNDQLIPESEIRTYAQTASNPKTYLTIPNADHFFVGTTTELTQVIFQTLDQMVL